MFSKATPSQQAEIASHSRLQNIRRGSLVCTLGEPMPGLLVDVAVQPGQAVRAGEKLAVIEAMKMENILLATQDGVVAEVAANKGESLSVDQVIIKFQ